MKKIIRLAAACLLLGGYAATAQVTHGGLTLHTTLTGEGVHVVSGGQRQGGSYHGRIQVAAHFDTQKAGLWKGGEFSVHGLNAHGAQPSATYVGDLQPISRIEAGSRSTLFEFWYRQRLGRFSALIGQHDMNSAFAVNRYGKTFLNTSFGMYPSVALNVPLSIYPVGAATLLLKWQATDAFSVQAAVYDGNPLGVDRNPHNLRREMHLGRSAFATVELGYDHRKDGTVLGSYKLGGFYHNGKFPALTDPAQTYRGNRGVYLSADHLVWREKAEGEEGLGAFLQTGGAPGNQNLVNFYLSSGLSYRGLLPKRNGDELGFGLVHSALNDAWVAAGESGRYSARTLIEVNYKAQLGRYFSVQPDVQYIIHPGAVRTAHNALIGMVRCTLAY
jgi:porin